MSKPVAWLLSEMGELIVLFCPHQQCWFRCPRLEILVSCGCPNQWSQLWQLKQQMYLFFCSSGAHKSKVMVSAGPCSLPPEALGDNPFFASSSFWWRPGIPCPVPPSLQSLPPASLCLLLCLSNLPHPLSCKDACDCIWGPMG